MVPKPTVTKVHHPPEIVILRQKASSGMTIEPYSEYKLWILQEQRFPLIHHYFPAKLGQSVPQANNTNKLSFQNQWPRGSNIVFNGLEDITMGK